VGEGKPLVVQVTLSWAPSAEQALDHAFNQREISGFLERL
jgi:hypothetical protein